MLSNRPEFHLADLAVMSLGAAPFSIYLTSAPEQVAYVVGDAGSTVAIVEEAFVAVLPELEPVIVLEGARGEGTLAWADVEGSDPELRRRERVARGRARRPADADLHVGHHGPAEGRPARAPQPDGRHRGHRGA